MQSRLLAVAACLLFCVVIALPADPADMGPWRPFQLGFTEAPTILFNIRVEDIQFQMLPMAPGYGGEFLVADLNVKNSADHRQQVYVSIALFNAAKELLCTGVSDYGAFGTSLDPREARHLKVNFGECGGGYTRGSHVKFFQVTPYGTRRKM